MSPAGAEGRMGNDFQSEATDNHLLQHSSYYCFDYCFIFAEKKSTFGLKLEILRSCREEIFLKLHFLLQEVLIFFLSEDKMIMCLTIRGEEINP